MTLKMHNAEMEFKNWNDRIEFALIDECRFEYDDEYNASNWTYCAVGERDKQLLGVLVPKHYSKFLWQWDKHCGQVTQEQAQRILSPIVYALGMEFSRAIDENRKEDALRINKIIQSFPSNAFYAIGNMNI